MRHLILSGSGRSGTTLLDKILNTHKSISMLSQPFPFLFTHAKRRFLSILGDPSSYYALSHLFSESRYRNEDLNRYLEGLIVRRDELISIFNEMQDYSGQYMKYTDIHSRLAEFDEKSFIKTYKSLVFLLRIKQRADYYGSKETHCEEFFPFFLSHSVKCVLLIRDPRDVITSFNYGKGGLYGGEKRPVLFYVRNWRKSVAFSLHLQDHPDFLLIKYEDLTGNLHATLRKATDFLGTEPFSINSFQEGIFDQAGKPWLGNSSFNPKLSISLDSIGQYQKHMPENAVRYIDATCMPEMKVLGYPLSGGPFSESSLREFRETRSITRKEFVKNYSTSEENIRKEIRRFQFLTKTGPSEAQKFQYFVFPDTYEKLRRALCEREKDGHSI